MGGRSSRLAGAFLILSIIAAGFAPEAGAQAVELGAADDLTVMGGDGTAPDPDLEVKGFSVFGSTLPAYPGVAAATGNVFVNGRLGVSAGAYFSGVSTFGAGLDLAGNPVVNAGTVTMVNVVVLYVAGVGGRPREPRAGMMMFNSDLHKPEFYDGNKWVTFLTVDSNFTAAGGAIQVLDGWKYHVLGDGDCLDVGGSLSPVIEVLVCAGGGGGGTNEPGGGGAGGCVSVSTTLAPGRYCALVGAGGGIAGEGGSSSFIGLSANGGGRGGTYSGGACSTGGSGGGGGASQAGCAGVPGQGHSGGSNYGGGGGAGADGAPGMAGSGGTGLEWPAMSGVRYGTGGNGYPGAQVPGAPGTGDGGAWNACGGSGTVRLRYPWNP